MNKKRLNHLCNVAHQKNLPLLAYRDELIELEWIEPPRPQASFGLINDWVEVSGDVKGAFAKLIIPFRPEGLGWVKRETLRLFRFDTKKKSFEKVDEALLHPQQAVVYATIDKPGVYGLIGLHSHPLVRETIRLLCELKPLVSALSEDRQEAFRDRICDLILCSRDMDRFVESREDFVELAKNLGQDVPDDMAPWLPRPAMPGETICDRCHAVDVVDLPECHIPEDTLPPDRPCKQAAWENVGPKHISGAMRQILIDPTDRRRLYAVSANGGIWRLDNVDNYPDNVWRPLTDRLSNLRFRTMAVAPSDGRILYAANSVKELWGRRKRIYSEVYRSRDRGRNWQPIHSADMGVIHRIIVHPANPDVVFAASSTGLWRHSATIGVWTNLRPDDCLDVAFDPDDSSIIYLGVRNQGIFKSFTSGSDWSASPILVFDPVAASDDPTTPGVDPDRQMIKIALGRLNKDQTPQTPTARTVVVRFGNEINASQTSGDDPTGWQRNVIFVSDGSTPPGNAALNNLQAGSIRRSDTSPRRSNEWCNCLAVDPFDADHILVGSVSIFQSTDGGQTWTEPGFLHHEDQHSLAFDPDPEKKGLVYVACDGGIFSSIDGGTSWPSMSLADTTPASGRGTNLACGLITSEFRHGAVRGGRCVAAIDHTGYILSENFEDRWQFLFNAPDRSARHGGHEGGFIFSCPASSNRWYVFNMRAGDDPTSIPDNPATAANERVDVLGRLAQFDFTRTNGLVNPPQPHPFNNNAFLSNLRAPVFEGPVNFGTWFPEDLVHNGNMPGPFAIRFSEANDERLILISTVDSTGTQFNIQSIRLATNGINVRSRNAEAANNTVPFFAIAFVPHDPERAFAVTKTGQLFERDFSNASGRFTQVSQWALSDETFVSRLVPIRALDFKLYLLTQNAIGCYNDDGQPIAIVHEWDEPNERLMSLVAHPIRDDTFFLGTSRGVYLSQDGCVNWEPYRQGMPPVPITELSFDQGYLYAATFGRGLWRCRPCPR